MLLRLQNSYASMTDLIRRQERTAHNLANTNTVGFKRDRSFSDLLTQEIDAEGAPQSERREGQWADMEQGALETTGNPLDLAVVGEGFFVLTDEASNTTRFTRCGRFTADGEGMLRDSSGNLVEGQNGFIQLPQNGGLVEISAKGEIRVNNQIIDTIRLVRFENPDALDRLDGSAFNAPGLEPIDVENPSLKQGAVESSNVDPIQEMTEMIATMRLFESQQKVLHTTDQVLGNVTRDLGRF